MDGLEVYTYKRKRFTLPVWFVEARDTLKYLIILLLLWYAFKAFVIGVSMMINQ